VLRLRVLTSHLHDYTHHIHRALTVLRDAEQSGEKAVGTDVPFELRGFSLATVGLGLGGIITIGSLAEVRLKRIRGGRWVSTEIFARWVNANCAAFSDSDERHARSLTSPATPFFPLFLAFSLPQYLVSSGSEGLSGVGFVYGIPILLIGLSLQYAQLNPVPVEVRDVNEGKRDRRYVREREREVIKKRPSKKSSWRTFHAPTCPLILSFPLLLSHPPLQSTPEADRAYEAKSTDIIKKIKKDVTRHRYGDDAHLDTTVQALGLVMPNKEFPQLQYLKQGVENGELTFSMVFKSDDTPYRLWVEPERIERYDKFFGPGVWSTVEKVDAERRLVAIKLITGERPASAVAPKQEEAETAAAATPASA